MPSPSAPPDARIRLRRAAAAALAVATFATAALGQAAGEEVALADPDVLAASIRALTILLVLSVLIESGLETVFSWRLYETYFAQRALKRPLAVLVSFVIVRTFELDVFASLLDTYSTGEDVGSVWVTELLTALILAGGSGAINNMLARLGVRTRYEPPVQLPPEKGWISIRVRRGRDIAGPVHVTVTEDPSAPADLPSIAGSTYTRTPSVGSLLFRNRDRFPPNGGYVVASGKPYRVTVAGRDREGKPLQTAVTPEPIKLAPGARVDFDALIGEVDRRSR